MRAVYTAIKWRLFKQKVALALARRLTWKHCTPFPLIPSSYLHGQHLSEPHSNKPSRPPTSATSTSNPTASDVDLWMTSRNHSLVAHTGRWSAERTLQVYIQYSIALLTELTFTLTPMQRQHRDRWLRSIRAEPAANCSGRREL